MYCDILSDILSGILYLDTFSDILFDSNLEKIFDRYFDLPDMLSDSRKYILCHTDLGWCPASHTPTTNITYTEPVSKHIEVSGLATGAEKPGPRLLGSFAPFRTAAPDPQAPRDMVIIEMEWLDRHVAWSS